MIFIRELLSHGNKDNQNLNKKMSRNKLASNTALYQLKRFRLARHLKVLFGNQDQDAKQIYINKN